MQWRTSTTCRNITLKCITWELTTWTSNTWRNTHRVKLFALHTKLTEAHDSISTNPVTFESDFYVRTYVHSSTDIIGLLNVKNLKNHRNIKRGERRRWNFGRRIDIAPLLHLSHCSVEGGPGTLTAVCVWQWRYQSLWRMTWRRRLSEARPRPIRKGWKRWLEI
jgi:hypothetical protein